MNTRLKKALYESIMKSVAKTVKHALNESDNNELVKYLQAQPFINAQEDGDEIIVYTWWHSGMDQDLYDNALEAAAEFEDFAFENDFEYIDGDQEFDDRYDICWGVVIPAIELSSCFLELKSVVANIKDIFEEGYNNI